MTLVTKLDAGRAPAETSRRRGRARSKEAAGFTLVELLVVVTIAILVAALALPVARNTIRSYRLNAAASAVAGAIQSTRYQAIMVGCPYKIAFTTSTDTYQVQTQNITGTPPACATTYSNVGGAIPWATSSEIKISANTTLQFNPNGTVQATTGAMAFTVGVGGMTKVVSVSGVGNVKVK